MFPITSRYRIAWHLLVLIICISICSCKSKEKLTEAIPTTVSIDPSIPDYKNIKFWAAHADAPGTSANSPQGMVKSNRSKEADVFYVHPTVLRSQTEWNQRIDDDSINLVIDANVIARQSSVFNDCCQVYAPRYRAATFLATSDRFFEGRGGEAYDLAYSDVLRAFDHFLEHENKGRPFIIAGHSQGGLMVSRLLKDRVDNKEAQQRMIAAYAIGYNLAVGEFGKKYKTLQPCNEPLQTGCVLSWNAITPEADLNLYSNMSGALYVRTYGIEEGKETLCINPLTWDASKPNADRSYSKGAVPGDPGNGPIKEMQANKVSASAQKGFLVVEVDSTLELTPLQGGSMHYHEFGLFYEDIRQNIAARIDAFK